MMTPAFPDRLRNGRRDRSIGELSARIFDSRDGKVPPPTASATRLPCSGVTLITLGSLIRD
jgi:hypothetical protein